MSCSKGFVSLDVISHKFSYRRWVYSKELQPKGRNSTADRTVQKVCTVRFQICDSDFSDLDSSDLSAYVGMETMHPLNSLSE